MLEFITSGNLDYIANVNFCAPFYQIILLLTLSTLALIFGSAKSALLINYCFALYWAYVFDRTYILEEGTKHSPYFPWLYFGFGFAVLLLAVIGFFVKRD
ncbi:MAG: hypothetical protein LJE96_12780 [Deltaproteobacteria bacterium]|nr:hypothetical protein [Deltaproteobacteria bacterium]